MSKNIYLKDSIRSIKRLLTLQDRSPVSNTYGCFDRLYWHNRQKDFPSAIAQISIHSLALLWKTESSENPYFKQVFLIEYIDAGIRYISKIQKKDGSFDEWYPNERGWAGPTGYIAHALIATRELMHTQLSEQTRSILNSVITRSCEHLCNGWEKDILSNHLAIAMLPLFEEYNFSGRPQYLEMYNKLKNILLKNSSKEGWCLEYDGPDIGYESATLSFLSKIHSLNHDEDIASLAQKQIEFLSYFFYPDGGFSHKFGARNSSVLFPFGLEYWAKTIPLASRLSNFARIGYEKRNLILPSDAEDHYLPYRISEFLETWPVAVEKLAEHNSPLPWEGEDFLRNFEDAGILATKSDGQYTLINLKKSGALLSFDINRSILTTLDYGWSCKIARRFYSTNQLNKNISTEITDDKITLKGNVLKLNSPVFNLLTMSIFKIFMSIFGFNRRFSYFFKNVIRSILIMPGKSNKLGFVREISLKGVPQITDQIILRNGHVDRISTGGIQPGRYVPQTNYMEDIDTTFFSRITKNQIDELGNEKKVTILKLRDCAE